MTWLLLLAALIAIAAVWLVLRPLAWERGVDVAERRHQLALVRERLLVQLNELDLECADGGIDREAASDERRRVEGELAAVLRALEELQSASPLAVADQRPRAGSWALVAALAAAAPLVAVVLYLTTQGSTLVALLTPPPLAATGGSAGQPPPMVLDMVARLERRLAEQPNDPEGWARLGRSYEVLNRPEDSKKAYARAYSLAPENVEILAAYATTLYNENPQETNAKVYELFQRLHRLEPDHPGALWFLGLASYRQQHFAEAARFWEQLAAQLPADNPLRAQVEHAIGEARARAKQPRG